MTTPVVTGSARWYNIGSALVSQTRTSLSASVSRAGMVPGDIAWDECCEGALMVSMPRLYRSDAFPAETEGPAGVSCSAPYEVAEYTVSVVRCAPVPQGQDTAVPAVDLDTAAGLLAQDMTEAMNGLIVYLCGLKRDDTITDFLVTPAETVGPEGDCVGLTIRVLIALVT